MVRRMVIFFVLMTSIVFSLSVTDMVNMGYNLGDIAQYIITHAPEFEPYMVEVAKVFVASGTSGAVTGAAALSTWAKFAAMTAWGAVAGLATYDIVKSIQLIGALVELNDIKKGIVAVREVQRYDQLGIQMMSESGNYQEYYVTVSSRLAYTGSGFKTFDYVFSSPEYFDGLNFGTIPGGSYIKWVYYQNGNEQFLGLAGGPSNEMLDFLYSTGVYDKTLQIAESGSYYAPAQGVWELFTPGWGEVVAGVPLSGSNPPLFPAFQPVGVITTPSGFSLLDSLTPEQWGNVRSLTDISPVLKFQYMPYSAYRNVSSYDNAPIQEVLVDTSEIVYDPNTGMWNSVDPQALQEIHQQIQSLTQTVQSILSQIQGEFSLQELQQKYETLQQAQVQLADLVETLSYSLDQVQTQTQTNTETVQELQEQAVELMGSVQSALETLGQVQAQVQTLTEQLNGVLTENDVIVRNLGEVQTAIQTLQQEYPQLEQQVQTALETLGQVQTEIQTLSEAQAQTQDQYQAIISKLQDLDSKIQTLSEEIQNVNVEVDLSPVVQAVNEVSLKVQALSEQVQSLEEYLHEGFFEKLGEKVQEILEKLFVPGEEELGELLEIELPEYNSNFSADISFSSQSVSIPIQLFGTTVDIAPYIAQYSSTLKVFMNIFVSAIAAFFVIRAFRVHLNID